MRSITDVLEQIISDAWNETESIQLDELHEVWERFGNSADSRGGIASLEMQRKLALALFKWGCVVQRLPFDDVDGALKDAWTTTALREVSDAETYYFFAGWLEGYRRTLEGVAQLLDAVLARAPASHKLVQDALVQLLRRRST